MEYLWMRRDDDEDVGWWSFVAMMDEDESTKKRIKTYEKVTSFAATHLHSFF